MTKESKTHLNVTHNTQAKRFPVFINNRQASKYEQRNELWQFNKVKIYPWLLRDRANSTVC